MTEVAEQQETQDYSKTDAAPEETPEVKEEEEAQAEKEIEYVCPPEFDERIEMKKMFVGGLEKGTTEDEFKELFERFGEIADHVIISKDNPKSDRLFGFITFAKCDDLEKCLTERPHRYKERDLDVKRAVPKGQDDGTGHFKVKKLHVANISQDFDVTQFKRYLLSRHPPQFGKLEEINILTEKDDAGNEKNRGFGFITVDTEDFADRIAYGETKFTFNGQAMRISKAKPRNSDGGGRGRGRGGYRGGGGGGYQNQNTGYDWSGYGGYGGYGGGYGYNPYGGYGGGYGGYDYYGNYNSSYGAQRGGGRGGRPGPY